MISLAGLVTTLSLTAGVLGAPSTPLGTSLTHSSSTRPLGGHLELEGTNETQALSKRALCLFTGCNDNQYCGFLGCVTCPTNTYPAEYSSLICIPGLLSCGYCAACPQGTYSPNGGPCKSCDAAGSGYSTCPTCSGGSTYDWHKKTCVCPTGQQYTNGKCSACPAGQSSSDGITCVNCNQNQYSSAGASTCSSCPSGSTSSAGSSTCTCTATGLYTVNGACPQPCAGGQQAQGGVCVKCPANTYSITGGSCQACPGGSTSTTGSAQCSCSNTGKAPVSGLCCAANQQVSNGKCACAGSNTILGSSGTCQCQPGYSQGAGSDINCYQCAAGWYSSGGPSCQLCPPGTFSSAGAAGCSTCPDGSVTPTSGSIQCSTCPKGQTNNNAHTSCIALASKGLAKKRSTYTCPEQFSACPLNDRKGGWECVNTKEDVQSCGGCWSTGKGVDCTSFDSYASARCVKGVCQCRSISDWGRRCFLLMRRYLSQGLSTQDYGL